MPRSLNGLLVLAVAGCGRSEPPVEPEPAPVDSSPVAEAVRAQYEAIGESNRVAD